MPRKCLPGLEAGCRSPWHTGGQIAQQMSGVPVCPVGGAVMLERSVRCRMHARKRSAMNAAENGG